MVELDQDVACDIWYTSPGKMDGPQPQTSDIFLIAQNDELLIGFLKLWKWLIIHRLN